MWIWIDIHREDCTLDLDSFRKRNQLAKTKWVAVGLASNGVGTVNDVATITREAKRAGRRDGVSRRRPLRSARADRRTSGVGCDFLACSAYKFFGPHVGVLWGRRELLESLPCYKLRPSTSELPGKWMTGTQNHEGLAGVAAAVNYLADLAPPNANRRQALAANDDGDPRIRTNFPEQTFVGGIGSNGRVFTVLGIRDVNRLNERVPTISITCMDKSPQQMAAYLASKQIYVHGPAIAMRSRCQGAAWGSNRAAFAGWGLVHYNTDCRN